MTAPRANEPSGGYYSTFPADAEPRIAEGTRVCGGRFKVVHLLARGGTAIVYRAVDRTRPGVEVALKVATNEASSANTGARYSNEARLGAVLAGHPSVVRPLDCGRLDGPAGFEGRWYLVTEMVEGVSLQSLMISNLSGLPIPRACQIARDVTSGLAWLHERGVVHRDLKPGNVIVQATEAGDRVRIIDFGYAYATGDGWAAKSPDLTADGIALGTPIYMSPQQATHSRPSTAFDVYAFGVLLYELLAGRAPYDGLHTGEMIARKCDPKRRPAPVERIRREVPQALAGLVERCMAYEPSARPDAGEIVSTLDDVLVELGGASVSWGARSELEPSFAARADDTSAFDDDETLSVGATVDRVPLPPVETPPRGNEARVGKRATPWVFGAVFGSVALGLAAWALGDRDPAADTVAPVAGTEAASQEIVADGGTTGSATAEAEGETTSTGTTPGAESESAATMEAQPLRPSAEPEQPSQSEPRPPAKASADRCAGVVQQAQQDALAKRWDAVLRSTKQVRCFEPDAKALRIELRVQALLEKGRHEECAALGAGSTSPTVARWASVCKARTSKGAQ